MQTDKHTFWRILGKLRACYPQRTSPNEWKVILRRYYEILGRYSPDVLGKACDRAWRVSPDFFPALGQLDELCRAVMPRATMDKQLTQGQPWESRMPDEIRDMIANLAEQKAM